MAAGSQWCSPMGGLSLSSSAEAAVKHTNYCASGRFSKCVCTDRDARIAKGIEAALAEYGAEVADVFSDGLVATANKAALAAFLKASQ